MAIGVARRSDLTSAYLHHRQASEVAAADRQVRQTRAAAHRSRVSRKARHSARPSRSTCSRHEREGRGRPGGDADDDEEEEDRKDDSHDMASAGVWLSCCLACSSSVPLCVHPRQRLHLLRTAGCSRRKRRGIDRSLSDWRARATEAGVSAAAGRPAASHGSVTAAVLPADSEARAADLARSFSSAEVAIRPSDTGPPIGASVLAGFRPGQMGATAVLRLARRTPILLLAAPPALAAGDSHKRMRMHRLVCVRQD